MRIKVNNDVGRYFQRKKDLRQGDLLSLEVSLWTGADAGGLVGLQPPGPN